MATIVNPVIDSFILAIALFFAGLILGRIAGKTTEYFLRGYDIDKNVKKQININVSLQKTIGKSVSLVIYGIFLVISLQYLGIVSVVFSIISFIVLFFVVVSVLLSITDAIPNLKAYFVVKQSIEAGKTIKLPSLTGKVTEIGLLQTKVQTKLDEIILVPNSYVRKHLR